MHLRPSFPLSLSLCGGVCLLCVCVAQTLVRAVGRAADALMRSAFPGQQFLFCCFPHCCSVLWPCKLLLLTPPTSATTLPACTSPSSLCCCVKYSYLRFACRHTSLGDALLCFFPDKLSQHLIFIWFRWSFHSPCLPSLSLFCFLSGVRYFLRR